MHTLLKNSALFPVLFLFSLKEEIRKENDSSIDLIRLGIHCSLVFPPVSALACWPVQTWTAALDESPTQRPYSYLCTLSCIKWMKNPVFAQDEGTIRITSLGRKQFQTELAAFSVLFSSSNMSIAMYMSTFQRKPSPNTWKFTFHLFSHGLCMQ